MKYKKDLKKDLEEIKTWMEMFRIQDMESKKKVGLWLPQAKYDNLVKRFRKKEELTIKERMILNIGDIKTNRIECLLCNDIITSNYRHDFIRCKCGKCFVDGGSQYLRRGGSLENIKELSEYYKDVKKEK